MKRVLIILLAAGVVFAAVFLSISHRRAARAQATLAFEKAKAERAAELERLKNQPRSTPAPLLLPLAEPSAVTKVIRRETANRSNTPSASSSETPVDTNLVVQEILTAVSNLPPRKKKEWEDPVAREALSLVGADPEAEEIWVEAINNPDLSAKERQDLIEDLNEDGFPDPKNLTFDDLPLILNRLAIIEEYAPNAMDDVNAAAFMEAYKDLINMATRLTQR
jgi:hypothetical protein